MPYSTFREQLFVLYTGDFYSPALLVVLFIAIPWGILGFRKRIRNIFAPGNPQRTFDTVTDFLWTPRKPILLGFLVICIIQSHLFFWKIYGTALTGVNRKFREELNSYASNRANHLLPQKQDKAAHKIKILKNSACTFYVPRNTPAVVYIEYLDFLYSIWVGMPKKIINLEKQIKGLNNSIEVMPSKRASDNQALPSGKNIYSRDEVLDILRRDRDATTLQLASETKPRPEQYIELDYYKGRYGIFLHYKSREPDFLGFVDYKCSKNPRELELFHFRHLVQFDFGTNDGKPSGVPGTTIVDTLPGASKF